MPGSDRVKSSRSRVIIIVGAGVALVAAALLLRAPAAASAPVAPTSAPPSAASALPAPVSPTAQPAVAPGAPAGAQQLVDGFSPAPSSMTALAAVDGQVTLPAAPLADGKARYYTLAVNGKAIPFFVLRSSDEVIRAAIDACDVCYPARKGYRQEGDVMVCNNCNSRFASVKINVETGGCNPAPLSVDIRGETVVIRAADIAAGAKYFS